LGKEVVPSPERENPSFTILHQPSPTCPDRLTARRIGEDYQNQTMSLSLALFLVLTLLLSLTLSRGVPARAKVSI